MNGFREMTLGEVVRESGGVIQTGPFGSQLHASDYVLEGVPLVMPANMGDNVIREEGVARVGESDVRRLSRHRLRAGDIVFSRRGDVGRRSIVRSSQAGWLCGTGCLAVKFGSNLARVNPEFVALFIGTKSAQEWLVDNAVGGTMLNLNTSILSALPIVLPNRAEQDAIVGALSDAYAEEVALEFAVSKKRDIKQGMMQELLTGATRLAGFAAPWATYRLGDLVSIDGGGTPPRGIARYWDGPIPWATIKDVSNFDPNGTQEHISRDAVQGSATRIIPAGTPILAARMLVGKAVRFNVDVAINQDLKGLHLGPSIDAEYLVQWFAANGADLAASAGGSTVAGTSMAAIKALELDLPEVEEQRAIAQVLRDADAEIAALERRLKSARAIKQGMMQQLLTGRTRLLAEGAAA